ncbi:MAG: transporter substrate-binding domain-containing protein [Myxococcota bacterium]|nr:transporter substrate-binding domain-containing protein [Myxococcota bacterium]
MRILRLLAVAFTTLFLAACQMPPATNSDAALDPLHGVIASGVLRIGLSGDQPPFNMRDRDGALIGLDVDLAEMLANAMGLETELVTVPFAELLPALVAARVDIVISAMTITPERNAHVPFAGPYYVSGTAALTRSDALARSGSIELLDDATRRYAAVAGTTNEAFAREQLPAATLVSTPDFDTAVALVLAGEVDAVLADFPLCNYATMRYPDAGFSEHMTPFTVEPLGVAIRADAPLLVNLVGNYLDTLEYAGLLGQLKARWLGDDAWLDSMP